MDKQPEALRLAEALAELDTQFSRPGLCGEAATELRRLYAENQQLIEQSLEEAKINGSGAERELKLMTDLENKQAELLRIKAHAEMQRMDDEALLRRALTYLEYASQQLPMIHASIVDPVIDEIKERLK